MSDLILTPSTAPPARRRGRPPGAKSKRSLDLARYIEAQFAGQTPGQQSAQLCMVTPKDLREAKALAKEVGLVDVGLSPMMLAMAVKARQLASAIGCEAKEAWLLLQKEREGLMAYVHQKQAPAAPGKPGGDLATVFLIPEGEAREHNQAIAEAEDQGIDMIEDFVEPAD